MRFVFILFSLLVSVSGFASPLLDSLRSEQRAEGLFVIHQVEQKETLYSIARRYGGSVQQIIEHNNIIDNAIDIGQIIEILVIKEKAKPVQSKPVQKGVVKSDGIHVVKQGETLYSLSKKYDVKIRELKRWNDLKGNDLSLGMALKVSEDAGADMDVVEETQPIEFVKPDIDTAEVEEVDPFEDFEKYLVQTGESITSIASKIGVSLDSLRSWNELNADYLKIGQSLWFKEPEKNKDVSTVETMKGKKTRIDEDGFERTYEEGVASVIETMNTSRFLALHSSLPIGTNIEVRNLMNNQVVHVKVVGKLPKTGLNKDIMIRLSKAAYEQLGILDSKSRVEVSYYK